MNKQNGHNGNNGAPKNLSTLQKHAVHGNGNGSHNGTGAELVSTPLLPEGYYVPSSRHVHPSQRMRRLLETEPYLFGPGVYDPMTAQLVMYYGFKAVLQRLLVCYGAS